MAGDIDPVEARLEERDRYEMAVRALYRAIWWSRLCTRMRF